MPLAYPLTRHSAIRGAALFAFGAVVLSFFDGFHTHSGTTVYRETLALPAAWWTPLLFASAAGFGGLAYALAHRRLAPAHPQPPWSQIGIFMLVYGACYAATAWVRVSPWSMLALLAAAAAGAWWLLDRSPVGIVLALATGVTGCATEASLIAGGHFRYTRPDVVGVPVWLFGLYLLSAVVVGAMARRLVTPRRAASRSPTGRS